MISTVGDLNKYINIATAQGSGVKFDNIQITTSYEAVCEQLGCGENAQTTGFLPIAGLSVLGIAISGTTYRYLKKKQDI